MAPILKFSTSGSDAEVDYTYTHITVIIAYELFENIQP